MVLRLTKAEMDALTKKARKAGLSREGYCRQALNGAVVKQAPPVDVPVLIREVRRVGNNLDQLLRRVNAGGFLDMPQFRRVLEENRAVEQMIAKAYTTGAD